ncbi:MAG: RIP metalloprotease RseP [Janthinobacterium lividum]
MEILVMIGQLVLGLSLLVGLHEFGHFAFAKLFKIKVTKFYIFFDFLFPLPNVLNFSLLKKKVGDTEYGIGWFPLGGYVAIHGMVDETQDADALAGPPQPDEFRSKPAWQRLLVMLGGIIMNIITGIAIFTALTFIYGEEYLPAKEVRYGIAPNKLGREIGFRTGDKIVKINGRPFDIFEDVYGQDVLLGSHAYYTVDRAGQLVDINVPSNFIDRAGEQPQERFVRAREPFAVGRVLSGTPAAKAGLLAGDRIPAVNGQPVTFFNDFQDALLAQAGKKAQLTVNRAGQTLTLPVEVDKDGHIGFEYKPLLPRKQHFYSLAQSVAPGTKGAFGVVSMQAMALSKMVRGQMSVKNMGGPVEIAQQFGGIWNWPHFWTLVGTLSMVLALMNLLPIPALDGGHVLFLLYEMILRRKPSDAFLENAQRIGTMLILALMLFVIVLKPILIRFHLL